MAGKLIPMETMNRMTLVATQVQGYLGQLECDDMGFNVCSYLTSSIMDVKYEKVTIDNLISDNCQYLFINKQKELHGLLLK